MKKNILIILFLLLCFSFQEKSFGATAKTSSATPDYLSVVQGYIDADKDAKAMIELNRISGVYNSSPKYHVIAARLYYKQGQLNDAESSAKKAVSLNYNNSDAFAMLGDVYFDRALNLVTSDETRELKQNYLKKSFDYFYTSCNYNQSSPFGHIGLAKVYYMNGQADYALDEILKAKELGIKNPRAMYLIGEYYYKIKEYDNAKSALQKSISLGMNSAYKTYYMLGTIFEQDGEIPAAQQNYLKALKLNPNYTLAQKNLDRLIKVSYKEAETQANQQKTTTDMFSNLNDELNIVMQADYALAVDEFTKARDLYIKVLSGNPTNINAITGLAEMYYAKWAEGLATSGEFVSDSKYIMKAKESSRTVIPFTKYKMINEDIMPDAVRQKLIHLSVSESFDFYDLLNEVRAEFLLGNFEESHNKLQKLLSFKLSNYEKFKVLKSLCYDHDNDEALILIDDLKKTYYHNEELVPIGDRIRTKYAVANEKVEQAKSLYSNKDSKLNDFSGSEYILKQAIKYFPTHKKAYLYYAYMLEKQKKYALASEKALVCYRLLRLYPEKGFEVSTEEIEKYIKSLNSKAEKN